MDLIRPAAADAGRMIFTPNPVTLEGQRNIALELRPGETLAQFLSRAVPDDYGYGWEVRINGVVVPHEVMARVRPKAGVVIEVRSLLGKQALYIVAMIALTYFTFGGGAATAGMWGAGAAAGAFGGGIAGALFASAIYAGGSLLINKVLGPKPPRLSAENIDSVYSIGAARNRPRPYQPPGLLFGRVRIAPDVVSLPYSWYEGNDQYVGMILSPGLNVGRVEPMDNADTPLSSYPGTQVYYAGFSGMPDQAIPLYRNADTVQGGELQKPQGGARQWVERTTPDGTVRIQVNLEYLLSDRTSKGKPINNYQTVSVEYRKTGTTAWQALVSRKFASSTQSQKRATLSADVPAGQYDVRVSRAGDGQEAEGQNGIVQFVWSALTCVQSSGGGAGLWPEIGVRLKATGSFSGAPDELRCIAESAPAPLWKNGAWVEEHNSNPGSHLLKLLRGIYVNGRLVAGLGLSDAEIDIEAFKAFMVHCDANGYTYDYLIREPRSIREMLASIAVVGMGEMTRNGGKHSIVWAAAGQPVSGVANMATIRRGTFQVDYALTNAADGVEYSYFDVDKWDTGIVRINAPGADSSLNPSRIAGEGITRAAHAAELARWHMAQSAYQYKDIAFSVSVEHLSFRRLSLLSVQHDLTRWGYGGCVVSATSAAGRVTLHLDVRVPAPKSGGAWIGLRIPGERNYRVLRVQPFAGESDTITLAEPWPADAPLPGSTPENPAHDTVWAYDFRETPGARVRVVSIQPESDLGGARVVVVPEPPEYWQYIKTGQYQRPQNQSLLPRRPAVSALKISEAQTVQGDTVFTELVANFDVSESVERCIVTLAQRQGSGWTDPEIVAETRSNTAKFRIPGAGRYAVSVRPYAADGTQGVAVTAEYATRGADIAPPAFDVASVEQLDGGIRRYSWAYTATPQPPDFAGAEIRYTAGTHNAPDWDSMTPLGSDGFFTAATESTVPESGAYTFAFRPRNTSGQLGAVKIVRLTLGQNIGQQIESVGSTVDSHTAQLVHAQQERDRIAQESLQRDIQGGLDAAADAKNKADAAREAAYLRAQTLFGEAIAAAAADATIKANGARDAALARINTIESQVADILSADAHSTSKSYPAGDLVQHADKLYRAKKGVPTGIAITNAAYWEYIGDYTSLGEAVSACIAQAIENRTALGIERTRLNGIAARMPAGTGGLATQAMVVDEMTERLSADEALASRASLLEASAAVLARNADFEAERVWAFDAGDDGWRERTANNSAWTAPAHAGSAIRAVRTPAHSIMLLSPLMSGTAGIDGSKHRLLRFRFRTSHGRAAGGMAIYFQTDAQQMAEAARVNYAAQSGTDWQTVTVDMSANARWVASPVRRIRIDNFVCREAGEWVEIDYVAVGSAGVGVSRDAMQQVNARIVAEETARARDDEALARRVNIVEARMPTGTGKLATSASVTTADNASMQRDNALANRATAIEARMPTGSGKLATEARVASVERAAADANQATADRATQLEARAGQMQAAITGLEHTASNDRQSATQRMDNMQADINGRATAGAVDTVTARVNKLGGGGNLLPNSGFERNIDNWRVLWNQHNIQPHVLVRDLSAPDWCPTGLHTIGQYVSALLPQGAHIVAVAEPIPVEPGKTYCFAGHIAQHRCDSGVGIRFLSADYSQLLSEPTNVVTGAINGGPNIADWRRVHVSGVAPAGAVWAQPAQWMRGRGQANPFAWLCQPMFCELADGQTQPPPYAPGGNELSGDFAGEVQRINSIHAAVTDPSTGLARAHGRVDDLAQVVSDNERTSSQRIINVESNLNTVRNGAGGGNLLRNSTFERDLAGWHFWSNNSPAQQVRNAGAPDWQPTGINTLALRSATQPPVGSYAEVYSEQAPVSGGETVAVSLHAAAHRCTARAWIIGKRADGQWTTAHHIGDSNSLGGADLRNWTRISGVLQLPPDTRWVQLLFRQEFATAADPVAWMCQPMLCRVLPDATDAPPYSPGGNEYAQAVLELKTEVDAVKGTANAIWGLSSNVNGLIDGMRSVNDGVRSTISFLTSTFRVVSNVLNGAGMEWQDGYLRIYATTVQMILGFSFGADGDLVFYYGPNVGAAEARKNNATIWFDKLGGAYFGGTLHAGIHREAITSRSREDNAAAVIGPFPSNGKARRMICSYSMGSKTVTQYVPGNPSVPPAPPSQSVSATVTIYRNGSALRTLNATGGVSDFYQEWVPPGDFHQLPGGGWVRTWALSMGESVTFSDTESIADLMYEARLTARSGITTPGIAEQTISISAVME